jgi:hypothetical protein
MHDVKAESSVNEKQCSQCQSTYCVCHLNFTNNGSSGISVRAAAAVPAKSAYETMRAKQLAAQAAAKAAKAAKKAARTAEQAKADARVAKRARE